MIIEKIKPTTREEHFTALYKNAFPSVARFVRKMDGTFDEAKDIFQDALIIYYEKRIKEDFYPNHDENAYVTGIARHLWYKHFKENKRNQSLSPATELKIDRSEELKVSDSILNYIELSGKKCLELLKSFYFDKMNMKELAGKFGFSGERSATAQKYKCLEKVRNAVHERSLNKEDFYE